MSAIARIIDALESAVNRLFGEIQSTEKPGPDYDVWEEVDNVRRSFWLGSRISRKLRPDSTEPGKKTDKLREELEQLETERARKSEEKQQRSRR
jgi:hypothetical protein